MSNYTVIPNKTPVPLVKNYKQKYKGKDKTEGCGEHHQKEKTTVAMPRVAHGQR